MIDDTIDYPESDGLPMCDTTRQFHWISLLVGNLQALFRNRQDVLIWGNQFWYPVEGEPGIHTTPQVYVVFGRPKGHRRSYKQWEEDNVPMTVVFEFLSPNTTTEKNSLRALKFTLQKLPQPARQAIFQRVLARWITPTSADCWSSTTMAVRFCSMG